MSTAKVPRANGASNGGHSPWCPPWPDDAPPVSLHPPDVARKRAFRLGHTLQRLALQLGRLDGDAEREAIAWIERIYEAADDSQAGDKDTAVMIAMSIHDIARSVARGKCPRDRAWIMFVAVVQGEAHRRSDWRLGIVREVAERPFNAALDAWLARGRGRRYEASLRVVRALMCGRKMNAASLQRYCREARSKRTAAK